MNQSPHAGQPRTSTALTRGFTIVESMIAALFVFGVALVVGQMFAVQSQIFLLNEKRRGADAQAEQLTNQLAARPREQIAAGGSDRIIVPATAEDQVTPTPNCVNWPCVVDGWTAPLPPGTRTLFARRWTINSADAARNLINVTIDVFDAVPADAAANQSPAPLVSRTTNIVPQ